MTAHTLRAMRVLVPNDLRLIWRDGFLLTFLMIILPVFCLGLRWIVPDVANMVAEWVELERYYGLIIANVLVAGEPVLLGFVIGVLFVEERDEGTLVAMQASPLSLRTFLGYRLLAGMGLNVLLTTSGVALAGLVSVPWVVVVASAALASLAVPLVALAYAVFVTSRVQALMALKPVQIWGGLPTLLFFVPTPWDWIGSVAGPLYYPMRLFWGAADGNAEWWLMVPGIVIPGAALLWLFRRFERTVYC